MRGGILYWHFVDIVWIAVYGIIYVVSYLERVFSDFVCILPHV